MDDFPGLLTRDFGFRPQGKSAPMKPSGAGSGSARSAAASPNPPPAFDDVFGGPPRYPNQPYARSASVSSPNSQFDYIFDGFNDRNPNPIASASSMPVFDKPVYDDDIFDGIPGMGSSAEARHDDVFGSMSSPPKTGRAAARYDDDLLGGLGKGSAAGQRRKEEGSVGAFDDLIPGFGRSSPPKKRESQESNQQKTVPQPASMQEDPFVVLETTSTSVHPSGLFSDPLEQLGKTTNSGSPVETSSARGGVFDDIDAFDGLAKSIPSFAFYTNNNRKDKSPLKSVPNSTHQKSSPESFQNVIPKTETSRSFDSRSSVQSPNSVDSPYDRNASEDQSPKLSEHLETADDVWLTVSEIPLFTQPTTAPPPSRPPPQLVIKQASIGRIDPRRKDDEYLSQSSPSYHYSKGSVRKPSVSPIDELEDFAMGKPQTYANERAEVPSSEEDTETNSAAASAASAAAMMEAMDRAEAKFKHAKEVRDRERDAKSSRSRDFAQESEEKAMPDILDSEKENQEKLARERLQREIEEGERERRRHEKEREQELAREREKARQAVERATKEARERAAAEARLKAERAAVGKANAEARQRAERHAVQRAAAEARERAAAEARERAERAAAEAKERASAEAREKAARERAAVDRAAAEARVRAERAAVDRVQSEARERAAAAAREKQHKTENDLDSFFGMGAHPSSAPKQRATASENIFDNQAQSKGSADGARRASSTSSSTIRKASSTTNIVDDLSSIFGATPSSGDFQEVEGETEERRRARLERHQRTLERAAKALAEKNERDMQTQREQAERHRIAETLDIEIKRWAAGKESNLRALLSTLQYVLWPECGWQPVSLTDLITGAAVKKVYRKATLCIHPDKVQQKGATLQQKYIAEKVFDLLKEAWNKFNSEELF
ncbi:auxilin-related protein 2-like [Iris pallida]|uniref:Auxilin-related protein 2-like n=1 Tax=Iris pallida TaxID=29817 RepID=A0AAX6I6G4_IRIPA|nr:auxilin-related protein 2-like [Iris pallida]